MGDIRDGNRKGEKLTVIHGVQPHAFFQEAIQNRHLIADGVDIECRCVGDLLADEIKVFRALAEF